MATVPSPRTWAVGELLTAAKLNTDLRNGLNFLLAPPLAILTVPSTTSLPNNATTALTWTNEIIDRDNGHNNATNNTRYTVQTAGYYSLYSTVAYDAGTNNRRLLYLRKNGNTDLQLAVFDQTAATASDYPVYCTQEVATKVLLNVGEYVEVAIFQNHGSAINLTFGVAGCPRFEVQWIST